MGKKDLGKLGRPGSKSGTILPLDVICSKDQDAHDCMSFHIVTSAYSFYRRHPFRRAINRCDSTQAEQKGQEWGIGFSLIECSASTLHQLLLGAWERP